MSSNHKINQCEPNTCSIPNFFFDEILGLLEPTEWSVLCFALRRTYGFKTYAARISITQFCDGTKRGGEMKDKGTGLSRATVIKCLKTLVTAGLLEEISPNNLKNEGVEYMAVDDSNKVNIAFLEARRDEKDAVNRDRTTAARKALVSQTDGESGQSDLPEGVSGTDAPRSVGQTPPGQSDRRPPVSRTDEGVVSQTDSCEIKKEIKVESQIETQRETQDPPRSKDELLADRLEGIQSRIIKACGLRVIQHNTQKSLNEQVGTIHQIGRSLEDFDQFLLSRYKTQSLNYVAQNYMQWVNDQAPINGGNSNGTHTSQTNSGGHRKTLEECGIRTPKTIRFAS